MSLQAERCNSEKEECYEKILKNKKESEFGVCNEVKRKIPEEHAKKSKEKSLRITHGHSSVNKNNLRINFLSGNTNY